MGEKSQIKNDKAFMEERNYSKNEKLYKEPKYNHVSTGFYYAIFRVGKKYKNESNVSKKFKTPGDIKRFQKHMQREQETLNSNGMPNEIMIGTKNIYEDVENYIKNVKLRSNSVIARELLLTASPGFFQGMPPSELERWKELNYNWLKKEFGDNCIYCVCHNDEKTYHLHVLIIPKFTNDKGKEILSNMRYFDGIDKFREWQDKYSSSMQQVFKSLNRGIRNSKAKHIEIKHFHAMVNAKLDEKDLKQVCAKAQNSELLEMKVKALMKTLESYKNHINSKDLDLSSLQKQIKELTKDKQLYKNAVEVLSQQYKIPQNAIKEVIKYANKEREK